eukprot:TRINITY_DN5686_c0_g2_i1.p1 TRINITY_DN5686_c0_g2~~TRINITY_DN5686_c0_g2_i1.p1  ORF type:complete len:276 (+),score=64.48 TRINITY_DN5686_c0_g2_i1:145-972(+)
MVPEDIAESEGAVEGAAAESEGAVPAAPPHTDDHMSTIMFGFGDNRCGQLGLSKECKGNRRSSTAPPTPGMLPTFEETQILQISCGYHFTWFLSVKGELWVVGRNKDSGQLALGHYEDAIAVKRLHQMLTKIVYMSTGGSFGFAIDEKGEMSAVGNNTNGQLGIGSYESTPSFTPVPSLSRTLTGHRVSQIGCGGNFSVFVTAAGEVLSCGSNASGQLGLGHQNDVEIPTLVHDLCGMGVTQVSCGFNFFWAMAVVTDTNVVHLWACGDLSLIHI